VAKRGKTIILVIIVTAAAIFAFVEGDDGSGPAYAPYNTGEIGTSLFYDTLRRMGYPVGVGYAPLTRESDTRYAYILIQPYNPYITAEMAEDMIDWVKGGGRLVFMHNTDPTVFDRLLVETPCRYVGEYRYYDIGTGSIVTGRSQPLTNRSLLADPTNAERLHGILTLWQAERIVFPVYYHGVHPPETMFSNLPLIIRLVIIQLGIATLALLWHSGIRFGKPVPAYEETEREENEHIRALARLYTKTERNNRNDKNIDR